MVNARTQDLVENVEMFHYLLFVRLLPGRYIAVDNGAELGPILVEREHSLGKVAELPLTVLLPEPLER